jgi:hypothetical protein
MWLSRLRREVAAANAVVDVIQDGILEIRTIAYRREAFRSDVFPQADYQEQIRLIADALHTLIPHWHQGPNTPQPWLCNTPGTAGPTSSGGGYATHSKSPAWTSASSSPPESRPQSQDPRVPDEPRHAPAGRPDLSLRPDPASRVDRCGAGASREDPLGEGNKEIPASLPPPGLARISNVCVRIASAHNAAK